MEIDVAESQETVRYLVNPHSLKECFVRFGERNLRILDLSFLRLNVEDVEGFEFNGEEPFSATLNLDRYQVQATLKYKSRGKGWVRFDFEKILPSGRAHLSSFLSAKKVGESILADLSSQGLSHFHGLNESELWAEEGGGVLFTYLDPATQGMQFIVRAKDSDSPLRVGRMSREAFIELQDLDQDFPLDSLTDKEIYAKLSDCRDILTNFRARGPEECALKQRLLKLVSEALYSTSNRVNMWVPRTPKPAQPSTEITPVRH